MKIITLTLSAIVAAFLVGFIFFTQYYDEKHQTQKISDNHFDGYMTHVHYFRTGLKGKLEQELTTPRAEHFPSSNMMTYTKPNLTIYPNSGGAWHVSAKHGKNSQGSDLVELWDHVELHRDPSPVNPKMDAYTSALRAYPHRQLVLSDKDVTMMQPGLTITGHGLRGNLENGSIKLLQNTQTDIIPHH